MSRKIDQTISRGETKAKKMRIVKYVVIWVLQCDVRKSNHTTLLQFSIAAMELESDIGIEVMSESETKA